MTSTIQKPKDKTGSVLKVAHRLLLSGSEVPPLYLLEELRKAYGALGAGMVFPHGTPNSLTLQCWAKGGAPPGLLFPWELEPGMLPSHGQAAMDALVFHDQSGASWLMTVVSSPGRGNLLFWVMAGGQRSWSPGERAGLDLVGTAWTRVLPPDGSAGLRSVDNERVHQLVQQAVHVAGRLAHDFGNYLTGILGFSELTMKQLPEGSVARRYLKEVWQSAQNGATWVSKLQTLGRKKATHFPPTDVVFLVRQEEDRARAQWPTIVKLSAVMEEPLPLVQVEAESLRSILEQLLTNAVEAIVGPGHVTLAARTTFLNEIDCRELLGCPRPGNFVEITIRDTGTGLASETRQRLFTEIFFSTKPRHRGLGLITVFWIVQMFHGGLSFRPHPDQGTTVRVVLPSSQESPGGFPCLI